MHSLFVFFIKNYKFSFLLTIFIFVAGLMGLSVLQRESRPPVDFAMSSIKTFYPGSSPQEVEEKITRKIEDELRKVSGLKDVKSVSQAGLSIINIRIDMDHFNTKDVTNEIQQAVQRVSDLPQDILAEPELTNLKADEIPILEIVLIGSNKDRKRDILADNLKKILEDDKGVSEVRLTGFREREYQILLDPKKMQEEFVSISEVIEAVKRRVQDIPAGFLKSDTDRSLVRVRGQVDKAEEMAQIIIRSNFNGKKVLVSDVAIVKDGGEDPSVLARFNGESATIITVVKKGQADGIDTVENLQNKIKSFQESLPKSYTVKIFTNEADEIDNRIGIVTNNATFGLIVVLVVLMMFLPGILGIMSSLSLPLAIFGSLALMPMIGANFNNVTMLAIIICLGMLVDNSVVISENYARLRDDGLNSFNASLKAVSQFWVPLLCTVLTTIAAFLPMIFTKGIMGEFIKWIPIVVTIALSISLFEGFFLLPARLQFTIKKQPLHKEEKKSHWFDKIREKFESFIALTLRFRYFVLTFMTVLLISSVLISIFGNRFELFPKVDIKNYIARFEAPISTNIFVNDKYVKDLSQKVYKVLGEENIKGILGYAGVQRAGLSDPEEKNDEYAGMLNIAIPTHRTQYLDPEEVLKKLRAIDKGFFTVLTFETMNAGPPVGKALNVTFRSDYYDKLQAVIQEFKNQISQIDGVVALKDNEISGGKEYRFDLNYFNLARVNLDTQKVGEALRAALEGNIVTELDKDGNTFDLRVRFTNENRKSLEALKKIKVITPSGSLIPITELATIREVEGPVVRKHFDFKRAITVTSEVIPQKITSVLLNIKARKIVDKILKDYPTVSVVFGGEDESTKESVESLVQAMQLAALGIFAILVFLFGSYIKPFVILSCIPLGLVGVAWAFFVHRMPLSFFSLIGVVGLAGVVVNSAIILMSYIEDLKRETDLSLNDILAKASADRFRAVLVTSLTTLGGLFPTAYGLGGFDSILVPMTMALAWGLAGGTFLTLIWIPCSVAVLEDVRLLGVKIKGLFVKKNKVL